MPSSRCAAHPSALVPGLSLALALVLALTGPRIQAAELPEMVISDRATGTLTAPSIDEARRRIQLTPGGVDVIDSADYRTGRASTLQDMLGYSPGVYIQPRFGSEESRLSIRGSGIQRTFHLRGVLLLQDGVPLSLADGGGDFQAIDPLLYRYIEVYRGANALQYGSTTLGGAINFRSPTGQDAAPFQARIETGSFDYRRLQLSSGGANDRADWFVAYSGYAQDGFRDHAEQENHRLYSNLGLRLGADLETRFHLALANTDSFLPGNLTKAQLEADPTQSTALPDDNKRDFPLFRFSNTSTWLINDATRLEANVFYSWKDLYHPIFQVLDVISRDYGGHFRLTHEGQLAGRRNQLVLGLNPLWGSQQDDRFVNPRRFGETGSRGAMTRQSDTEAQTLELFFEDQFHLRDDLALIGGAQYTRTTREVTGTDFGFFGTASPTPIDLDKTYTGFSPKLGLRWDRDADTQLYTNLSRSYEPPSFSELTGSFTNGFADAQEATTFELGSRGQRQYAGGNWGWDVAYYRAVVDGELLTLADPSTPNGSNTATVNSPADTIHQGLELGWTLDAAAWRWRNSLAWNDFTFDGNIDIAVDTNGDGAADQVASGGDGNRLGGIPEWIYRTELLYQWGDGLYAGPSLEWVPDDWAVDHANTLFADAYSIWGLKIGQRSSRGWSWFIEGRNLTDETYAATTGVILNANGMDQPQFLPGDGRAIYVGIEYALR